MRARGLTRHSVEVAAQQLQVNRRCAPERRNCGVRGNEASTPQWREVTNWHTISRDDERLAAIKLTHDLAALVAKLSLGYFAGHAAYCST